jgi:hypothetical protein
MMLLVTIIENKDYRNLSGTLQIGNVAVRRGKGVWRGEAMRANRR